jgi:hypothetical protein
MKKMIIPFFMMLFALVSCDKMTSDFDMAKQTKDKAKKTETALVSFTFSDPARGKDTTFVFNTVDSAIIYTTADGRKVYCVYMNAVFADQFRATPHEHLFQIGIVDNGPLSPGDYLQSYNGEVKTSSFWQFFPYDGGGYAAYTPYKTTVVSYNPSKYQLNATFGGEWVSNGTINGLTFIPR